MSSWDWAHFTLTGLGISYIINWGLNRVCDKLDAIHASLQELKR